MNRRWTYPLVWGLALSASVSAIAGDWRATDLGSSVPLWYEYRASVNDAGTIAATRLVGRSGEAIVSESGTTTTVLSGRPSATWPQSFAQDITSDNRVVGFHATANPALRQASWWTKNGASWDFRDLHASVVAAPAFSGFTISSAYAMSARSANSYYAVGYARAAVNPGTLSQPALWTITDTTQSAQKLTLPANHTYGIAYGVSDVADKAGKRYACGGTGTAGGAGYMSATCWDISAPSTPNPLTISEVRTGGTVATSVVNRVRTIDLGTGTGDQAGLQTLAVGYFVQTNGAVVGFVKNLTTGAFDISTALGGTYDAILSDVTIQHYSQPQRANVAGGVVYNGPMVVGSSASSSSHLPGSTNPLDSATTMRGVAHTRIAKDQATALTTATCNLELQVPANALASNLEQVSGVSRSGLHMVGYAAGKLVRLTNRLQDQAIALYSRDAEVFHGAGGATRELVTYHWAEVTSKRNAADVQIIWGERAGCQTLQTGLVCTSSLQGEVQAQRTRRSTGAGVDSKYIYIQAATLSATDCALSPVYALSNLPIVNPTATDGTPARGIDTTGAGENWQACGAGAGGHVRQGTTTGRNVDVNRDFYHCGACNNTTEDGLYCTEDTCVNGTRTYSASGIGCWIGGQCYANNSHNPASTAYARVNASNSECNAPSGVSVSYPPMRDPCSVCRQAAPTGWTSLTSTDTACCAAGKATLDTYDRADVTGCTDTTQSFDRNDGRTRTARWKDPRSGYNYHNDDDWSENVNGVDKCLAFEGSETSTYGSSNQYHRPRRINASFTPPVDTMDWYQTTVDDKGATGSGSTPKPRARVISRDTLQGTSRRVRMELCIYVDCTAKAYNYVKIKNIRFRGTGLNSPGTISGDWVHTAPVYPVGHAKAGQRIDQPLADHVTYAYGTPAWDARGACLQTNDAGIADISIYDYDCDDTNSEIANIYISVRPVDVVDALSCSDLDYTLYYGNDKKSGAGVGNLGCDSCCN